MLNKHELEKVIKMLISENKSLDSLSKKYAVMEHYLKDNDLVTSDDLERVNKIGSILSQIMVVEQMTGFDMVHHLLNDKEKEEAKDDEWTDDIMARDRERENPYPGWGK